jgi:hypothetical protein
MASALSVIFFCAGTSWGKTLLSLVCEAEVSLEKRLMFLSWNTDFLPNQPHFLCRNLVPVFRSYSNFVFVGNAHTFKSLHFVNGALRYKLEGRGFDSRLCYWIFSLL